MAEEASTAEQKNDAETESTHLAFSLYPGLAKNKATIKLRKLGN